MKNLIILLIVVFGASCDYMYQEPVFDSMENMIVHDYILTVSGDCDFVSIGNIIYHELPEKYIENGTVTVHKDLIPTVKKYIQKHTNDNSTISIQIDIDGFPVLFDSCSEPYCEINI